MAIVKTSGGRIAGICTCVPSAKFDNVADTAEFTEEEVRKVTGMAGVSTRHMAGKSICSSDLCFAAAQRLMNSLGWAADSIDALIMVTQTPDYLLPSTSCLIHQRLGLGDHCAAFDVGQGCSGYPYAMWLAGMMLQTGGVRRALVLHGETPTRFTDKNDRSVALLFGDAGSATALEADPLNKSSWHFALHSDGTGFESIIIQAGGFRDRFNSDPRSHCVTMDGAQVFNFTIKRVPALIDETLTAAQLTSEDVDYFIFHQSNQFIIKHLCAKQSLPAVKVPMTLKDFGNTGGVSIPLTITEGGLTRPDDRPLNLLLLGYGVGLSWASALVQLDSKAVLDRMELDNGEKGIRMTTFAGKTIVVSGASSGIGRSVAETLGREGANLILIGRNRNRLDEAAERSKAKTCHVLELDLSKLESIAPALEELAKRAGRLYGLCHAAGTVETLQFSASTPEKFQSMLQVNYLGGMELARVVCRRDLMELDGGSVLFISSIYGLIGKPGQIAYSGSKGAVAAAARAMAIELARRNIRVNVLSPGMVKTDMIEKSLAHLSASQIQALKDSHPLGIGNPEDVAGAAAFLLSPGSKWITGTELVVDGGYSAQ